MPRRLTQTKEGTLQTLKNMSYESTVISWLMYGGWQVFNPVVDNGHKTDVLISDGPNYYRIQIKTLSASGEDHLVNNQWEDCNIDYIIYFARNSTWGYIAQAFNEKSRHLNHPSHARFESNSRRIFLKEFNKIGQ